VQSQSSNASLEVLTDENQKQICLD